MARAGALILSTSSKIHSSLSAAAMCLLALGQREPDDLEELGDKERAHAGVQRVIAAREGMDRLPRHPTILVGFAEQAYCFSRSIFSFTPAMSISSPAMVVRYAGLRSRIASSSSGGGWTTHSRTRRLCASVRSRPVSIFDCS